MVEPIDENVRTFGCEAILFDLDGVLVDSTAVVVRVWREWARDRGLDAERILEVAHGRPAAETVRLFAPHLDADSEARELERMETENLDSVLEVEGARELLSALPANGWTLVTSGTRALASSRIEHVGLPLPERFVSADDVENGKPHPEAYLRGAEILGVRPEACVVVEDAPSGVSSAKSAGMRVVAVATTYRQDDLEEADAVASSLAKIRAIPYPEPGTRGGPRFELRVTG
jgi:sugar-phosphatase